MVRGPASGPRGTSTPGRPTGANATSAEEAPPASPEALLAAVAQSCDREAFRQLFGAFAPGIKRYLCARGAGERVPSTPADEQLLLAEERQALARAIQDLPGAEVEVLRSAYFEGLSMQQIAERQALPLGTVKTRSRRALERLRILLRRHHA